MLRPYKKVIGQPLLHLSSLPLTVYLPIFPSGYLTIIFREMFMIKKVTFAIIKLQTEHHWLNYVQISLMPLQSPPLWTSPYSLANVNTSHLQEFDNDTCMIAFIRQSVWACWLAQRGAEGSITVDKVGNSTYCHPPLYMGATSVTSAEGLQIEGKIL